MDWIKTSSIALMLCCSAFATQAKHCLWEVQGENASIYVLGSLPMIPESVYPLPQIIEVAYQNSDHVIFEFDPYLLFEGMQDPRRKFKLIYNDKIPDPDQPTALYEEISGELYGKILDAAAKLDIPESRIQRFRPPFVGIYLNLIQMDQLNFRRGNGMDVYFQQRAGDDKKSFEVMDTLDEHLARFLDLPLGQKIRLTEILLDDFFNQPTRLSQGVLDAWRVCDERTLENTLNTPLQSEPEIRQTMMEKPIAMWHQKIKNLAQNSQTNVFTLVEMPSVTGTRGLINRLRQSGLTVRQH